MKEHAALYYIKYKTKALGNVDASFCWIEGHPMMGCLEYLFSTGSVIRTNLASYKFNTTKSVSLTKSPCIVIYVGLKNCTKYMTEQFM